MVKETSANPIIEQSTQSSVRKRKCYGMVNPEWFNLKLLYFFEYGALGSIIPFVILFFNSCGLSASQVGLIELSFTFIGSITRPIFGSIADKTGRHRLVLGLCILVFSIIFFSLMFVRPYVPVVKYPVSLLCNSSTHEFAVHGCETSKAILYNVSNIQPEFFLHHVDVGFHRNCPAVNNSCQLVCGNFVPKKAHIGMEPYYEPFSSLAINMGRNNTSVFIGSCFEFPISVAKSHNHVSLACETNATMSCELDCGCSSKRSEIDPKSYLTSEDRALADNKRIFFTILMLRCIGAIPFGPSISLADSISYDVLGPKHRNLWGQQRLFGTLAWGLIAPILGFITDTFYSYDPIFYSMGIFGVSAALIALFLLPKRMPHHHKDDQDAIISPTTKRAKTMSFKAALMSVFKVPIFSISCFVALTSGMFLGVLYVVWPMLITKDLKGKKFLIGITAGVSCGLEIPSLFFAGAIVNKLGEFVCFLMMYAAYAVRFVCYAFLTSETVWIAVPLEILHQFCFAFYITAATRLAASIAPPGTSHTIQAILQASYFGFGLGIGNLLSSLVYERFGGHIAFLIYAAFAGILFFILLIVYFGYVRGALSRMKKNSPERIGSFSPNLNPEASFVDEEEDNQKLTDNSKSHGDPLVSSAPHHSEL